MDGLYHRGRWHTSSFFEGEALLQGLQVGQVSRSLQDAHMHILVLEPYRLLRFLFAMIPALPLRIMNAGWNANARDAS